MNTIKKTTGSDMLDTKAKLSTLWIFILLNVIFADIHGFFKPRFLEEIMTGSVNGTQLTEELFLLAAIGLEIPIAMVLLSRVLKYRVNRWANIIGGAISIMFVIVSEVHDLDDMFFATVEVIDMLLIIWYAWTWPKHEA